MKRSRIQMPMFVLLAALLAAAASWQPLAAQDAPAVTKTRAKPRGRLPAYYSQVVSNVQREKIYTIQQSYSERIEALQAQLQDLQSKMQGEIRGVLTPEQQKKVEELTEAARKSRGGKAAADEVPATAPAANSTTVKRAAR
jgi:TolA-binding protein